MDNIRVIEYTPAHAKAVADMWAKSSEGWNGGFAGKNEENVRQAHEAASNINTYLAASGNEILGYCSFSQYMEDEGALYVKLLNVRYDCHGKGIGKILVKKSVERTIELDWPRLDLYTWAGNLKSIPLYKRCGFFFERRYDTVHLMNFIPYAVNTEATAEFFKEADWYDDLKLKIDIEPDGITENGFDYYGYRWEKEGKMLRMEFERRGRGLRLIETDDYIIYAALSEPECVFGKKYKINYEVINKSGKNLSISFKGEDNKNIQFDFEKTIEVKDKENIEGNFYVGEIKQEVNVFKTHPAVISHLLINGKKATFKLGIIPKYPAKVSLSKPEPSIFPNQEDVIYLQIENNFNEEAQFSFTIPQKQGLKLAQTDFDLTMKPKEKRAIPISVIPEEPIAYQENITIKARLQRGDEISFKRKLAVLLKGRGGFLGIETDAYYAVAAGHYTAKLDKFFGQYHFEGLKGEIHETFHNYPKLGQPYSDEFSQKKPEKAEWYKEEEKIVMKVTYASDDFAGFILTAFLKLSADGLAEQYYEVKNTNETDSDKALVLSQSTYHNLNKGIVPYDGRFIEINESVHQALAYVNMEKVDENWLYAESSSFTRSLFWDKGIKPKKDSWLLTFEHDLGKIPAGGKAFTKPVYVALDTFKDWRALRVYATRQAPDEYTDLEDDVALYINEGNPFVKDSFKVLVKDHKLDYFVGSLTLSAQNSTFENQTQSFTKEENIKEAEFTVTAKGDAPIETITMEADLHVLGYEKKTAVFRMKDIPINSEIVEEQGHKVYKISNGIMEIKASPTFAYGLHSWVYKGHEWLDNSFPTMRPKSWYNPWTGGIFMDMYEVSNRALLLEDREVDFTRLKDSFGNAWQGIRAAVTINNNEKYKGLTLNQYYLMLPGVPVLCYTAEIISEMEKTMIDTRFHTTSFFNMDADIKNNWVKTKNKKGKMTRYRVGRAAYDIVSDNALFYGSDNMKERLQIFTKFEDVRQIGAINIYDTAHINMFKMNMAPGERVFTKPVFYILTEEFIEEELLGGLRGVRFE